MSKKNTLEEISEEQLEIKNYTVPNKLVAVLLESFLRERICLEDVDYSKLEEDLRLSLTTYLNLNFEKIEVKVKDKEVTGIVLVKDNPQLDFVIKFNEPFNEEKK